MNDPEYGQVHTSRWLRNKIEWLRANHGRFKFFFQVSLVATLSLIIRAALIDMDSVVQSANAITFDEEVYEPFSWSSELRPEFAGKYVKPVQVKSSPINANAQQANIRDVRDYTRERYLDPVDGFLCLHVRYIGVLYDIIVFRNYTMVNPVVRRQSEEITHNTEIALDGTERLTVRPRWIEISYYNEYMQPVVNVLYSDQSACFTHYFSDTLANT